MRQIIFILCIPVLIQSCSTSSTRKCYLATGYYAVNDTPNGCKRLDRYSGKVVHINPKVIIDVQEFEEASMVPFEGKFHVNIMFTNRGARRLRKASKKYLGKSLALVVDDELIMATQVMEIITNGSIMIDAGFSQSEMTDFCKKIQSSIGNY